MSAGYLGEKVNVISKQDNMGVENEVELYFSTMTEWEGTLKKERENRSPSGFTRTIISDLVLTLIACKLCSQL